MTSVCLLDRLLWLTFMINSLVRDFLCGQSAYAQRIQLVEVIKIFPPSLPWFLSPHFSFTFLSLFRYLSFLPIEGWVGGALDLDGVGARIFGPCGLLPRWNYSRIPLRLPDAFWRLLPAVLHARFGIVIHPGVLHVGRAGELRSGPRDHLQCSVFFSFCL